MMRHYFSVREEVEVDECPGCGGVWLDQGELRKIRSLFRSEEERDRAARERFADLFDAKLHRARAQSLGERERARRFARLFRYICPSFYVPGKQRWGAF
jgi:Zn-finger nucleic acid-binding protein